MAIDRRNSFKDLYIKGVNLASMPEDVCNMFRKEFLG
jgi:hypothetical protein